jgi:hypothetical protein
MACAIPIPFPQLHTCTATRQRQRRRQKAREPVSATASTDKALLANTYTALLIQIHTFVGKQQKLLLRLAQNVNVFRQLFRTPIR